MVVGCDEAGRGPLAGPVVSACCHVPLGVTIDGICDSKAITCEKRREEIFEALVKHPKVKYATAVLDHNEVDRLNILQAAMKGMADSVIELLESGSKIDFVLIDGPHKPRTLTSNFVEHVEPIVKGDSKVHCIAAASIIAKVTRDRIMADLSKQYPVYEWKQNKGYPTPAHKALIKKHGPCPLHRKSFNPVRTMLGWTRAKPKEKAAKEKKKPKRKSKVARKKVQRKVARKKLQRQKTAKKRTPKKTKRKTRRQTV